MVEKISKDTLIKIIFVIYFILGAEASHDLGDPIPLVYQILNGIISSFMVNASLLLSSLKIIRNKIKVVLIPYLVFHL